MKIIRQTLKCIIKEEVARFINEENQASRDQGDTAYQLDTPWVMDQSFLDKLHTLGDHAKATSEAWSALERSEQEIIQAGSEDGHQARLDTARRAGNTGYANALNSWTEAQNEVLKHRELSEEDHDEIEDWMNEQGYPTVS